MGRRKKVSEPEKVEECTVPKVEINEWEMILSSLKGIDANLGRIADGVETIIQLAVIDAADSREDDLA